MGIFNALFAGVNGINSNGNAIAVVGDNISNVNTTGFKASSAAFEDILAGADSNVGLGSRISDVVSQFSQGGFESTSNVTDLAIDGNGFFVVRSATDSSTFYSRNGQFHLDKDGYITNTDGLRLQGFQVDTSNNITADVGDVLISQEPVSPNPSADVELNINLSSNSTVPSAFSTGDPTNTSNFSAGVTVYDSLGNSHLLSIYFRKSSTNTWSWYALANGIEVSGATASTYYQGGTGTMTFTTSGGLQSVTTTSSYFSFIGAGVSQAISFDFGTFATAGTGGALDGVTQFGSDSAITNITQDGFASGSLKSIDISSEGIITGNYTNGTNQQLGQIVLATFNSQSGLSRTGSSNYRETLESGLATLSAPQTTGKGSIVSSTLEQSNVDLANELIKMVIIQRGFQANTRTIGTINDMLAQLVTLGQG